MRRLDGFVEVSMVLACAATVCVTCAIVYAPKPAATIPEKQIIVEVQKSTGCWTEAGWYGGGRDLMGLPYKAKGMVCAANMPELKVKRGDTLMISRIGFPPIVCRVNDFGPDRNVFPNRGIDLSPDAADALGMRRAGISKVFVMVLR